MPGPGKRKGKAKKSNSGGRDLSNVDIPTVLDAFIDEINDTRDWNAVVEILCRMFDFPDLNKRSGLKKIHANFDEIQKNLDAAYTKYQDNEKVAGGIVGIWAAMCADSLLRNRLFHAGLLEKMMPLFNKRSTRYVGLQALSAVTHHGGVDVRKEIARHTPSLIRLMEELPDDREVNEMVIVTLAHSIPTVVNDEDSSPSVRRQNMSNLDIPTVLRLLLRNLRNSDPSPYLLSHALQLLSSVCLSYYKEVKAIPSLMSLLTACLRSKDVTLRATSFQGLFCIFLQDAVPDRRNLDPNLFMSAIQRGFPSELNDILMSYGPERCDTYLILQATTEFQKALQTCVQDPNHDLYKLGLKLSELVLRTEYSITDGMYQARNERTGQMEVVDVGLPFQMWSDALPHCATAMRNKGTPADLDKADILECKFFIHKQRLPDAYELAKRAIARSPQVAYFYYVIGLSTKDVAEGLRASKKGLRCSRTSPFVRNFLLWRATDHAATLGLAKLQGCRAGDVEYSEGVAFLTSALEDAKAFVSEAPPDTGTMSNMITWFILLTIILRGPELSLDLNELGLPLRKLELTRKFAEFFRNPQLRTQSRLTREHILKYYKTSFNEWKTIVEKLDEVWSTSEELQRSAYRARDNLAAWLEGLSVEDGEHDHPRRSHSTLGMPSVELYRCSYCGNPSAVLRKCSGCGKTRYCDAGCQKQHWSDHKAACKKAQESKPQQGLDGLD
ncbi:hypothetical protein BDY19DRAFT_1071816 [Irpex rosettiformis]|uniref:Uncharacterized protein n=1 Tax=Irpex rosettiformis TaxID=378272 RepID=A0ACB8U1L5_9APHY|nr:hypothetical protein BDY19DRAFT_1071816 [Irpex rosettiformis]